MKDKKSTSSKSKKSDNVKVKINLSKDENKKLKTIAKKLDVNVDELFRIFTLGIDENTPKDILMHHYSFYPFGEKYHQYCDNIQNNEIPNITTPPANTNRNYNLSFDEYKQSIKDQEILAFYKNKYKKLDIRFISITTLKDLYDEIPYLIKQNSNYCLIDQGYKITLNDIVFENLKQLGQYIIQNDEIYKDIKKLLEDDSNKIILLYGNEEFNLLKVLPYKDK
jgi:hypothetical protein